jgi:hypothetical protein
MSKIYMSITPRIEEFLTHQHKSPIPASIDIDELYRLVAACNEASSSSPIDINSLLEGSFVVHRTNPPSNISNLTEIELLRLRADEKKYQKSIKSLNAGGVSKSANSDIKAASESISFATHFILAFGSAFLAGYYFAVYGLETESDPVKYMCGGVASFLTLLIEAILFIIREEKNERIKQRPVLRQRIQSSPETVITAPEGVAVELVRQRKKIS